MLQHQTSNNEGEIKHDSMLVPHYWYLSWAEPHAFEKFDPVRLWGTHSSPDYPLMIWLALKAFSSIICVERVFSAVGQDTAALSSCCCRTVLAQGPHWGLLCCLPSEVCVGVLSGRHAATGEMNPCSPSGPGTTGRPVLPLPYQWVLERRLTELRHWAEASSTAPSEKVIRW